MAIATPNAHSVSRNIDMEIVLDNGMSMPMPCTLSYSVSDPFAVSAEFRSTEGSVTWVFGRELLMQGLHGPAGDGDIRITPVHAPSQSKLRLSLSSPHGQAVMEGALSDVQDFIDATLQLLPEGFEWQHLNFDNGLSELLNDDAA